MWRPDADNGGWPMPDSTVPARAADTMPMGFLNYAMVLFVLLLLVTLYVMRRRSRQGRRTPKF